jgi:hypothetical protein
MTNTYMWRSMLVGAFFFLTLGTACVDDRLNDSEADSDPANRANEPFYVKVFDHVPDEGEIQADFERFLLASRNTSVVYPGSKETPHSGQKLVRIDATTGTQENAGTHAGSEFRFRGTWEHGDGEMEFRDFALGNPDADEALVRGKVSIFYYLLEVSQVQDKFLRGKVVTFSGDGWYCVAIDLYESNHWAITRKQHLLFNQSIDYPNSSSSDSLPATNSSWLRYR